MARASSSGAGAAMARVRKRARAVMENFILAGGGFEGGWFGLVCVGLLSVGIGIVDAVGKMVYGVMSRPLYTFSELTER